jgi:GT2 family glycosyltransferase
MKAKVSIVLGSYNRLPFLKGSIQSIRDNGIIDPYEIIVVDGGSTDGSIGWLSKQKDIITIVQHNHGTFLGKKVERKSWGYFMNLAFKASQGEYICMVSDDTVLVPGAVMNGIQHIEDQQNNGRKIGAAAFYWRNNWPVDDGYMVSRTFNNVIFVNHGLYMRSALEEINWIEEERYQFYCADIDLCYRLHKAGYEVIDVPNAFVEHFFYASHDAREKISPVQEKDTQTFLSYWKGLDPSIQDNEIVLEPLRKKFDDANRSGFQYFPQGEIRKIKASMLMRKIFRKANKIIAGKGK